MWKIVAVPQWKTRNILFLAFAASVLLFFSPPLYALTKFALKDDTSSYIPLIPLVSTYFFWERRKEIFAGPPDGYSVGGALIAVAIVLYIFGAIQGDGMFENSYLTVMSLSFVACVAGGVALFFGPKAWRAAAFPLIFLLFMIPIPGMILDPIVIMLQRGSAEVSYGFFHLIGVPVYRDGFLFSLPGMTIEVAKQCSGIRSGISLLLVSLLAGQLFLRERWRRGVLVFAAIPITIAKNAVRIVLLTSLAVYVDPAILGSVAHRRGGIPIFLLALILLGGALWMLRRGERSRAKGLG